MKTAPSDVPTAEAVDHLERLAAQLEAHAFQVRLTARTGLYPRLRVINPMAPSITEDVLASHERDGEWWFWLSWAGRIGHASDIVTAAERIASVLHVIRR
ncbi:hypothetical protein Sru01_34610 [Sphaerisporangium rufum]|uniref:Uncharacterized protein n=1 Tax=Sphaerisporangium rufum TaxID=1381558 RepID=A0A919V073_9ACTN|nr:hypothetical protein [Sphaerisporangium rufum]GII78479.1 hypothetical protein Sru01_34610 [Sphaerisporangium rufum]